MASVCVAEGLQAEEIGGVFGAVEHERTRGVDGYGTGARGTVSGFLAGVQRYGVGGKRAGNGCIGHRRHSPRE